MTHYLKNSFVSKKLAISFLLMAGVILFAEDNTTLSNANSSTFETNSTVQDLNQSVENTIVQIKPIITNINMDGFDDDIIVEGNASKNLDVEVVFMINNNRIIKNIKSDESGYWSINYKDFKKPLEDGIYDVFVSTKDTNGVKSEIASQKNVQRDTIINGIIYFSDGAKAFSDDYVNSKELQSAYIYGEVDSDAKVVDTYLYNENDQSVKLRIANTKVIFDNGKFSIASKDVPMQMLGDGTIFVGMEIEDNHKNKMTLRAKILKDTIKPEKPTIIKSVKNNNMVNGQALIGLVFLGNAEQNSKVEAQIYNVKYPETKTGTLVKTDESSSWTIVGRDLEIKNLREGNIVSELVQIDVAGNRSDKVIVRSIKEPNPIFPTKPEFIPSENYMPIHIAKGVDDVVRAVVVNDTHVITGTFEFIHYFDKKRMNIVKTIEIKRKWVNSLAIHDNKLIVALDSGEIQIRNILTGDIIETIKAHTSPVLYIKLDGTNKMVSSSSDGNVKIWDLTTYKELFKLQKHQWDVAAIAIKDGKVYTGSDDYSIKIWDLSNGKFIKNLKSAHSGTINSLVIYKDKLISASDDKKIHIRDINTSKLIKTLDAHKRGVNVLKINKDKLISASKDRTLIIWDLETYEKEKQLRGHSKSIVSLDINDENFVTGSLDYKLRVWGYDQTLEGLNEVDEALLGKYDLVKSLKVANSEITSLAQTDSEIVFATYGYVNFYNSVTYQYTRSYTTLDKVQKSLKKKESESSSFTDEDEWGEEDSSEETSEEDGWESTSDETSLDDVQGWEEELEQKKKEADEQARNELQWINKINIQGTRLLAGLGYKNIKIWDLERNRAIDLIEGHESGIRDIKRSDDFIISTSADGAIKIWNQEKMELQVSIDAHQWDVRSVVIDDGKIYSGSDDYSIKVWDMESGDLMKMMKSAHNGEITKLAIYDKYLISASKDGTIIYRDKESLKVIKTLNAHDSVSTFVLDDENLVSGGEDSVIKVWRLKDGKLITSMKDGHDDGISALMITDDYIVSGGKDKKINIWKYYE